MLCMERCWQYVSKLNCIFFNHQVLWGLGGWGEAGSGQVHLPQWRCLHCKNDDDAGWQWWRWWQWWWPKQANLPQRNVRLRWQYSGSKRTSSRSRLMLDASFPLPDARVYDAEKKKHDILYKQIVLRVNYTFSAWRDKVCLPANVVQFKLFKGARNLVQENKKNGCWQSMYSRAPSVYLI